MHRNCVMQLPLLLLSHLQLSSPSLSSSISLLPSPLRDAASSPLQLSYISLLCSPLRDAASSPLSSAALLSYIYIYISPSAALLHVMQLPLLSHLQLSSPPYILSTAWCSFLASHLQLSSISPLHCVMQLPLFLSHLQLYSLPFSPPCDAASSPFSSAALLSSISSLHCVMQLPLSHLQLSSPPSALLLRYPLRDAASSPHPLSSAALLSSTSLLCCSPPLSTAWCSFLSSSAALLSSISPPQLPLLSPLQLSYPPPFSTAWCSFLSSISPPLLRSPLLHLYSSSAALLSSAALHSSSSLLRFSSTRQRDWVPSANLPPKLYKRLIRHLTQVSDWRRINIDLSLVITVLVFDLERKLLITCHNLNNNKTGFECWETLGRLRIINLNIINHFAKQSPLLFSVTYVVCTRSNHDFVLVASPMSRLKELSQRSVTCLAGFLYWWFGPIYTIAYWYRPRNSSKYSDSQTGYHVFECDSPS